MLQGSSTRETRQLARELKFLVSPETAKRILAWARERLSPDAHGSGESGDEYRTTSVYFDTENLDVYHRRGSFRRSKYRVRHYTGTPTLFLERKLRTNAMVIKRRTAVGPEDLDRLRSNADDAQWGGYWFQRRLGVRQLRPTCQVSYRRIARVGVTAHGPVRLTCDREVCAQHVDAVAFLPEGGTPVLSGHFILELKFRVELPGIFKQLVEEFALEPLPVSKYRLSLEALDRTGIGRGRLRLNAPADQVDIVDA